MTLNKIPGIDSILILPSKPKSASTEGAPQEMTKAIKALYERKNKEKLEKRQK